MDHEFVPAFVPVEYTLSRLESAIRHEAGRCRLMGGARPKLDRATFTNTFPAYSAAEVLDLLERMLLADHDASEVDVPALFEACKTVFANMLAHYETELETPELQERIGRLITSAFTKHKIAL